MRMTPLRRFAQQLKDQVIRDQREGKYTAGCGYWNNGDGNEPDEGFLDNVQIRMEPMTLEKEPYKEIVDSTKNIFGQKGELLQKKKPTNDNKDNPVCIDIEAQDSETPAPIPLNEIVLIDEEESKDASTSNNLMGLDDEEEISIVGDNISGFTSKAIE